MSITIIATFDYNHARELSYPNPAQHFAAQIHLAADPHCTTPDLPDIAELTNNQLLNMYMHALKNPYRSRLRENAASLSHFEGGLAVMHQEIVRRMGS
ncbi:hypothetical protein JOF28_000294 [Leucobacter exalbidus]|uniref:Uncharacterized protein n=1 Tax=Leucobacter exalbidus TaxID=662960 RepID=A0A940PR31_9MICO|nr:hypothetical protein [Leucobacter exalbidus]MBP1325062.1 hypothetical protein [Leucobacter exalbidus]